MKCQFKGETKLKQFSIFFFFWIECKYVIWLSFLKHVWYKLQTVVRIITPDITKYFKTRNCRIFYAYYSIQFCFLYSYGDNKWIKRYGDTRLVDPWTKCHSSHIVCLNLVKTRAFSLLNIPHKTVCGIN